MFTLIKGGLSYLSVNAILIYTEESCLSVNALHLHLRVLSVSQCIMFYTEVGCQPIQLCFTLKKAICQSMHYVLHLSGLSANTIMFYT